MLLHTSTYTLIVVLLLHYETNVFNSYHINRPSISLLLYAYIRLALLVAAQHCVQVKTLERLSTVPQAHRYRYYLVPGTWYILQ